MKHKVLLILSIIALLIISLPPVNLSAESDNSGSRGSRGYYTYDYWGNVMESAPAYVYKRELSYDTLGLDKASIFSSVYYKNNNIYIADQGLNGIYVVDYDFNVIKMLYTFSNVDIDGNPFEDSFSKPQGITADDDGNIYVADSNNSRILIFNPDYTLKKEIKKPDHLSLEGLVFTPIDVSVSYTGRIYVVGENVTYGIMELDTEGNFLNFVGTNLVSVSAIDLLWRSMMNAEQRKYASLILPQQFRSIDVDTDGFIYCTSLTQSNPIKRLNFDGANVLVQNWYYGVIGDVKGKNNSEFIAISANDLGIYMALDRTKYRVFVYNCDGEMMYMLGGNDRSDGHFLQPVDLCWLKNDDIAVCDSSKSSIIIFEATEFGKAINQAARYHYYGRYEDAHESWELTQKLNSNYDLAYIGIGKTYLYTGDYKKAMEYFKLGNDRSYYSKAYSKQMRIDVEKNFGFIVLGVVLVVGGIFTPKIIKRVKNRKEEKND